MLKFLLVESKCISSIFVFKQTSCLFKSSRRFVVCQVVTVVFPTFCCLSGRYCCIPTFCCPSGRDVCLLDVLVSVRSLLLYSRRFGVCQVVTVVFPTFCCLSGRYCCIPDVLLSVRSLLLYSRRFVVCQVVTERMMGRLFVSKTIDCFNA